MSDPVKSPAPTISQLLSTGTFYTIAKILAIGAGGLFAAKLISNIIIRIFKKNLTPQLEMVIRKTIFYTVMVIIVLIALNELGIGLTPFLGAAGIIGIALGFASQTSIANLISGLFLISEKPFEIGDIIKVSGHTGIIHSIDLLSTKIRTFTNQYIRIPNQKILNEELINLTRFPVRRLDINLTFPFKEHPKIIRRTLQEVARNNNFCLDEPEPMILFKSFETWGQQFLFAVWCQKRDYLDLMNTIMEDLKMALDREGIEIAIPAERIYLDTSRNVPPQKK